MTYVKQRSLYSDGTEFRAACGCVALFRNGVWHVVHLRNQGNIMDEVKVKNRIHYVRRANKGCTIYHHSML